MRGNELTIARTLLQARPTSRTGPTTMSGRSSRCTSLLRTTPQPFLMSCQVSHSMHSLFLRRSAVGSPHEPLRVVLLPLHQCDRIQVILNPEFQPKTEYARRCGRRSRAHPSRWCSAWWRRSRPGSPRCSSTRATSATPGAAAPAARQTCPRDCMHEVPGFYAAWLIILEKNSN